MSKLDKKIEELETNRRIQRQNAEHYFHDKNDDERGHYWQDASNLTKGDIAELRKEKAIVEKWRAIEMEPAGPAPEKSSTELRAEIQDLSDNIHGDIDHGECFYDKEMLSEFCGSLDQLKIAALRYYLTNARVPAHE